MKTLDEIRAKYPHLGLALYAYEPGGMVTLECHSGKEVFVFVGPTEAEAVSAGFPDEDPAPIEPPASSVFD